MGKPNRFAEIYKISYSNFFTCFENELLLSATYRKKYKQNMYILISYIQVKSLVADTLYTIFAYCILTIPIGNMSALN